MIGSENVEKLLQGRKAFITGASRGIGRAIAEHYVAQGAELHLNAVCKERLELTAQEISRHYDVPVYCYAFDVAEPDAVKQAFQGYRKTHGELDILVNNAGIMNDSLLAMVSSDQLKHTFSTNVFGPVYCSQYASRLMARQNNGVIINVGSIMGERV